MYSANLWGKKKMHLWMAFLHFWIQEGPRPNAQNANNDAEVECNWGDGLNPNKVNLDVSQYWTDVVWHVVAVIKFWGERGLAFRAPEMATEWKLFGDFGINIPILNVSGQTHRNIWSGRQRECLVLIVNNMWSVYWVDGRKKQALKKNIHSV